MESINFDVTPLGEYDIVLEYHGFDIITLLSIGRLETFSLTSASVFKCLKSNLGSQSLMSGHHRQRRILPTLVKHNDQGYAIDIAATTEDVNQRNMNIPGIIPDKEKPPLPGHGPHDHEIPIQPGKNQNICQYINYLRKNQQCSEHY